MKCPTFIRLNFNPLEAKDELFKDCISLIIWCCVGANHLRSQYFNDEVKDLVKVLKEELPQTYSDFKSCLNMCRFDYGKDCKDQGTFLIRPVYCYSDEFWVQIWNYIKKHLHEQQLQLSLFPEKQLEIRYTQNSKIYWLKQFECTI